MIWTSIPFMTAIDLAILAIAGVVLWVFIRNRMILQPLAIKTGPALVVLGLGSIGLFFFADLMTMHALPLFVPMAEAMAAMENLHHNLNWLFILVAVASIVAGFRLITRDQQALIQKVEISKRDLSVQLAERGEIEGRNELLAAAIESLDENFSLYDKDDRLVMCNERCREFNRDIAETLEPGARFEDLIRAVAERGLCPEAKGREDEWIEERLERHRNPREPFELARQDGQWLLIREQRLPDGCTLSISTNITAR